MQETEATTITSRRESSDGGGRQPHLLQLGIDLHVLLDVLVLLREVGLGLVVVVVGDEVLDGVVREELAELGVELGRQGLVVGDHQGGPAAARAMTLAMVKVLPEPVTPSRVWWVFPPLDAGAEGLDRLGLGAGRDERGLQVERSGGIHQKIIPFPPEEKETMQLFSRPGGLERYRERKPKGGSERCSSITEIGDGRRTVIALLALALIIGGRVADAGRSGRADGQDREDREDRRARLPRRGGHHDRGRREEGRTARESRSRKWPPASRPRRPESRWAT